MYYYVFLDNNVVTWKGALPSQLSLEGYMEITAEQYATVEIGMMYIDGEFVTPSFYYAILDPYDVVEKIVAEAAERTLTGVFDVVALSSASAAAVGQKYDRATQTFISTNPLTESEANELYAPLNHAHTGYAAVNHSHTEYAPVNHTHTGYAAVSHTHDEYAAVDHTHTASDVGAAPADHTHSGYAAVNHTHAAADVNGVVKSVNGQQPDDNGNVSITVGSGAMSGTDILTALAAVDGADSGLDADKLDGQESSAFATADHNHDSSYAGINHTHSGYAAAEHTHTGYAASTHNHDSSYAPLTHTHTNYAAVSHTHSQSDVAGLASALNGKADSNHTRSGYASSSHTHSNYYPTSGGIIGGDVNVQGILRVNGQQSIFDSGEMITLSTNNRKTMISGSEIYSKVAISTSSDARLKENIADASRENAVEFIKNVDVKTFNYIGNERECSGVIAQEVQKANPEIAKYLVQEDGNGYLSVKISDIVFPLIMTVQRLMREVEELRAVK